MRTVIQSVLEEISDIDVGPMQSDDLLEDGQIYFGYQIQEDVDDWNFDRNCTISITLTGYVSIKEDNTINTLASLDDAKDLIISKLKEINFKSSYNDVSIDNGIRKIRIVSRAKYSEINQKIIV